jgi:hypothetical protein
MEWRNVESRSREITPLSNSIPRDYPGRFPDFHLPHRLLPYGKNPLRRIAVRGLSFSRASPTNRSGPLRLFRIVRLLFSDTAWRDMPSREGRPGLLPTPRSTASLIPLPHRVLCDFAPWSAYPRRLSCDHPFAFGLFPGEDGRKAGPSGYSASWLFCRRS